MKVVILAGGLGSRIAEESQLRPKPMITIGNKPILWHIMKIYSSYGFNEFIICCGYKGAMIKRYFLEHNMYVSDVRVKLDSECTEYLTPVNEKWKITMVNTGLHTLTAGRILKVRKYLNDEPFMLTYGDGVGNINIPELIRFHKRQKKTATITVTRPMGRFGAINLDEHQMIHSFREKSRQDAAWVNAGFAVFNPDIFTYLGSGDTMLETRPFEELAKGGEMTAYKHEGFWSPMDTIRDRDYLEGLWRVSDAPWKTW